MTRVLVTLSWVVSESLVLMLALLAMCAASWVHA